MFAIQPLVGAQYQPVIWTTIVSSFIIVFGVIMYKFGKFGKKNTTRLDVQVEDPEDIDHPSEKNAFLRTRGDNLDDSFYQ